MKLRVGARSSLDVSERGWRTSISDRAASTIRSRPIGFPAAKNQCQSQAKVAAVTAA